MTRALPQLRQRPSITSMKRGKIIAVLGAPAAGKSTFIRNLAKKFQIRPIFEGEQQHFPEFIKKNIENNCNGLQLVLFFYNKEIEQYSRALEYTQNGETVVLDTFWLANLFYLDSMIQDKNDIPIIKKLIFQTEYFFPWPDWIIYIDAKDQTLRKRIGNRGRGFEKDFLPVAIKVSKSHRKFFRKYNPEGKSKLLYVFAETISVEDIGYYLRLERRKIK